MAGAVNPDLQRARESATFQPCDLTYVLYGGPEKTRRRRAIENLALNDAEIMDSKPVAFQSRSEAYGAAVRKAVHVLRKTREYDITDPVEISIYREISMPHELNPIGIHTGMFIPTIVGQGTPEQIEKWLPRSLNYEIIGTYAQTEMGHGTFLRNLETTATYDPRTEEFVLNCPTLTATKWWPGSLGKSANFAIVMAQLYSQGKSHGIHSFILQIRSLEDHRSLPGVTLGDIGPKFGFEANDNGFMRLNNVRIPSDQMLMRYAQVTKDGTYTRSGSSKLTYGSMLLIRALITFDCGRCLAQACTIAIRYSAVRRQSELKAGEREPPVLDYQTQQYKLLPNLAISYALWFAGSSMKKTYTTISDEIQRGDTNQLPQLHALSAGLKAFSSWVVAAGIEECRMACGGHGYSMASGLPTIYKDSTAACTYEGENTVMMLQVARYLMKCYAKAKVGEKLPDMLAYLNDQHLGQSTIGGDTNQDSYINAYRHRAQRLVREAANRIQTLVGQGQPQEDAWNMTTVLLVKAAYAHTHYFVVKNFVEALNTEKMHHTVIPVLTVVCELFALHGMVQDSGSFLMDGFVTSNQMTFVQNRMLDLLSELRPNAVALVDAFDFHDRSLCSVLGRYDGRVYENLYQWAQQSPLNETDVHDSYYKYLRPLLNKGLQSNL